MGSWIMIEVMITKDPVFKLLANVSPEREREIQKKKM